MKRLVSVFYRDFEESQWLNDQAKAYAASKGIEYEWVKIHPFDKEKVIDALANADAGLIDCEVYDKEIFSRINERNHLLIRYGVGYDAVNLEDAKNCGIRIARTQGANATAVAEMALTMMMMLKRDMLHSHIQNGVWNPSYIGHELTGSTVGILGFGAVGKTLAKILSGFDCRILAYDTYQDHAAAESLGVVFADLETIFRESDAISVHLALNPDTKCIIDRKLLGLMKPTAVIVNTARGGLVNDADLIDALKNRTIGGAGLDVFTKEPLSSESEYHKLDNVVLTSHIASSTMESFWNIYKVAIDIADNVFNGREDTRLLV